MTGLHAAEAYSFASRFVLREVTGLFPERPQQRLTKTQIVADWEGRGVAYAFDFGALVFIDVPDGLRSATLEAFLAHYPREPHPPLREDLVIEVKDHAGFELSFDRVVVPELTPATREVVATVLAQSAAIDYYDEDVQAMLDRIGALASDVARHGRPKGQTRDLMRFYGSSIASQVEIISAISLLDKPDLTWEDERADRLHDRLRYHLEIPERHRALEAKLMTSREALQVLLHLASERRMFVVELAILVLILAELVLGFLQLR